MTRRKPWLPAVQLRRALTAQGLTPAKPGARLRICAWCLTVLEPGTELPASHGICEPPCEAARVAGMDAVAPRYLPNDDEGPES